MSQLEQKRGKAWPLGASRVAGGMNFSLYASSTKAVTLEVEKDGWVARFPLQPRFNQTGHCWHVEVAGLEPPFDYLYFVNNPRLDNSNEIPLIDPYAISMTGMEFWGQPNLRLAAHYREDLFDWEDDHPPGHPMLDSIIYELHVRGFTMDPLSEVDHPGMFEGVIEKIPYLQELGVTAVELLPVHEFDETDNPFLHPVTRQPLRNFWGYSTINFFSPKMAYGADKASHGINSFKAMVKALHEAKIEVILDVVFNHTAEGGEGGRIFNFKALAPEVYYLFTETGEFANYSGCGNTMNCNHPVTRKMILDALVYWVVEMHVDGFRFDLASILTRDEEGRVLPNPPLLEAIAKHPVLSGAKIIAEAWDAQGLYQVGAFPASHQRWAEWNGRFRDCMRRFARGNHYQIAEAATRLAGSEDLYKHSARNPFHSINFITSHDGFTLMDLVSYEEKHNLDNGEDNHDGTNDNLSENFGAEGPTEDEGVNSLRFRQLRNLACLLLLSQGTPMILAGDEFGNSQQGNNNAWCQDSPLGWVNWQGLRERHDLFQFWKKLIQFRKKHPLFSRREFYTGKVNPRSGLADLSWHGHQAGKPEFEKGEPYLALLLDGMQGDEVIDECLYIAFNFSENPQEFCFPAVPSSEPWMKILDTAHPKGFLLGQRHPLNLGSPCTLLEPRSLQVWGRAYLPGKKKA